MRRRRAFSLVEAMVFGLLALVIFGLIMGVARSITRESARAQLHLKGLQAVLALQDRIELDLRSAIFFHNPLTDKDLKLEVDADGAGITFHRYALDLKEIQPVDRDGRVHPVPVQRVRYAFEKKTGAVSRQLGAAAPEVLAFARFRTVVFARALATASPAGADPLQRALDHFFRMEVAWAPDEQRPGADPDAIVLRFGLLLGLALEAQMEGEVDRTLNPTSKFAVEP